MENVIIDWLQVDGSQPPKRKRAEQVCSACHSRKVKCDLQKRTSQGHGRCTGCDAADRDCEVRPSKRKKRKNTGDTRPYEDEVPPSRASMSSDARADAGSPSSSRLHPDPQPQPLPLPLSLPLPIPQPLQQATPQPPPTEQYLSPESARLPHPARLIKDAGPATGTSAASDVDTGFLQVYGPENKKDAEEQEQEASTLGSSMHTRLTVPQQELHEIFAETYLEHCFTWCPVLEPDTIMADVVRSPLLANALALAASHIRPPLLPHDGPAAYYKTAVWLFYNDEEPSPLTTLQALSLFYWWAPRPPSVVNRHSSWWWQSVIIRHAQQMNLHREPLALSLPHDDASPIAHAHALLSVGGHHIPTPVFAPLYRPDVSIRRRIWWTAYARERLTALCQSKPCIIDPEDCNIPEPTLSDFPPDPSLQQKGLIFIHWVKLCGIMGRIAKELSRASSSAPFPCHLRRELADWVQTLPPRLSLPILAVATSASEFDKDVHQLYLPYLTTIIVLHLRRSAHAPVPQALPPAILAASCIARILRDVLSRGDARFLPAITCWFAGTSFIALLQACRIPDIASEANAGLDILTATLDQLQRMWGTAKIVRSSFDRLRKQQSAPPPPQHRSVNGDAEGPAIGARGDQTPSDESAALEGWGDLFPFVSRDTSGIAAALLPMGGEEPRIATRIPTPEKMLFAQPEGTSLTYMTSLLDPFGYGSLDFPDLGLPGF